MKKNRYTQFNVALNEEDREVLRKLRDKYDINISGCFKRFLKLKLAELENIKNEKE